MSPPDGGVGCDRIHYVQNFPVASVIDAGHAIPRTRTFRKRRLCSANLMAV